MLLTALPPAPPTPHTMIRGFNSRSSGALRLIDIAGLIFSDAPPAPVDLKSVRSARAASGAPIALDRQKLCFSQRPTRAT